MLSVQGGFKQGFPVVTLYTNLGEDAVVHGLKVNQGSHPPPPCTLALRGGDSYCYIPMPYSNTTIFQASFKWKGQHYFLPRPLYILSCIHP